MAKTKIKLRPDQSAIVFNADGTCDTYFHEQPDDIAPTSANLACAFARFAIASTPPEAQLAIIASMDEDGDPMELGIEELGDVQIGPAEMGLLGREIEGMFVGTMAELPAIDDGADDDEGSGELPMDDVIDVEFEEQDDDNG